jgi:hypothetical protein
VCSAPTSERPRPALDEEHQHAWQHLDRSRAMRTPWSELGIAITLQEPKETMRRPRGSICGGPGQAMWSAGGGLEKGSERVLCVACGQVAMPMLGSSILMVGDL